MQMGNLSQQRQGAAKPLRHTTGPDLPPYQNPLVSLNELNSMILTSTGAYRSCAALFDISNPLRYLIKSSLVWMVLVWFGLVDFILGLHGFGLVWLG